MYLACPAPPLPWLEFGLPLSGEWAGAGWHTQAHEALLPLCAMLANHLQVPGVHVVLAHPQVLGREIRILQQYGDEAQIGPLGANHLAVIQHPPDEIVAKLFAQLPNTQIGGEEGREAGHRPPVKQARVLLHQPRREVPLAEVIERQERCALELGEDAARAFCCLLGLQAVLQAVDARPGCKGEQTYQDCG